MKKFKSRGSRKAKIRHRATNAIHANINKGIGRSIKHHFQVSFPPQGLRESFVSKRINVGFRQKKRPE